MDAGCTAIVEGFARAKESGAKVPRAVLVPHENLAVAMAHGAYLITGTPQAVILDQLERFSAQVMPAFKTK